MSKSEDEEFALIRPENPRIEIVARVFVKGNRLKVFFPKYNEKIASVMSRNGLLFNRQSACYEVGTKSPSHALNRAANVVYELLEARFIVKGPRPVVDAAIKGDFTPLVRRGVRVDNVTPMGKCFVIWWRYGEDLYKQALRLPGASYIRNSRVAVPPESFEQVLAFIEKYQCVPSDDVIEFARAADDEYGRPLVVSELPKLSHAAEAAILRREHLRFAQNIQTKYRAIEQAYVAAMKELLLHLAGVSLPQENHRVHLILSVVKRLNSVFSSEEITETMNSLPDEIRELLAEFEEESGIQNDNDNDASVLFREIVEQITLLKEMVAHRPTRQLRKTRGGKGDEPVLWFSEGDDVIAREERELRNRYPDDDLFGD